jgi:hypothetical protein
MNTTSIIIISVSTILWGYVIRIIRDKYNTTTVTKPSLEEAMGVYKSIKPIPTKVTIKCNIDTGVTTLTYKKR